MWISAHASQYSRIQCGNETLNFVKKTFISPRCMHAKIGVGLSSTCCRSSSSLGEDAYSIEIIKSTFTRKKRTQDLQS